MRPAQPPIQRYEYDALNRLTSARETTNALQSWQQLYRYDRFGNRSFKTGTTLPASPHIEQDALTNPTTSPATNRFDAGQGYTYDSGVSNSAGNLTSAPGYTYTFDAENRLSSANYAPPNQQANPNSYAYDGDGRRVQKVTSNGQEVTIFVYDVMGQLVCEYNNLLPASENQTSYVTSDTLGTPRVITKANGSLKSRHDYFPFGEELQAVIGGRTTNQGYSQPSSIRQGFTGYEKDGEMGLNFAQARYYSSTQGRFTSVDPENAGAFIDDPQSWNGYAYSRNNPLLYTDPTGMKWAVQYGNGKATFQWYDGDTIPTGEGWRGEWQEYNQSWFVGSDEAIYLGSGGASDYYRVAREGYFTDEQWSHFRISQQVAGHIYPEQIQALMNARIDQFTNSKPVQDYLRALDNVEKLARAIQAVEAVSALRNASKLLRTTSTGMANRRMGGGFAQANKDFDSLPLSNVRPIQTRYGPGRVGTLPDGTQVVVRSGSRSGEPTLQLIAPNKRTTDKFRY